MRNFAGRPGLRFEWCLKCSDHLADFVHDGPSGAGLRLGHPITHEEEDQGAQERQQEEGSPGDPPHDGNLAQEERQTIRRQGTNRRARDTCPSCPK